MLVASLKTNASEIGENRESKVDLGSCVSFIRHTSFWGWDFPTVQNAGEIPVTKKIPILGSVALFNYARNPHAALVVSINYASSTFDVLEANFVPNSIGRRTISFQDKALKGFFAGFSNLASK